MKGPLRPHTMQTATPFTTSAAPTYGARRVGNSARPREDCPVTIWPASSRARYVAWRSA
jgi:hypothetical protein